MNDEKLEQLLKDVYSQDIAPTEELVRKTKRRLSGNRFTEYLIALVILFNLAGFLAFIGFIATAPYSLVFKAALYMIITLIYNSFALAAFVCKDSINEFFQKF